MMRADIVSTASDLPEIQQVLEVGSQSTIVTTILAEGPRWYSRLQQNWRPPLPGG